MMPDLNSPRGGATVTGRGARPPEGRSANRTSPDRGLQQTAKLRYRYKQTASP